MTAFGCSIKYWWVVLFVVVISHEQSQKSIAPSSCLFVDGKGYGGGGGRSSGGGGGRSYSGGFGKSSSKPATKTEKIVIGTIMGIFGCWICWGLYRDSRSEKKQKEEEGDVVVGDVENLLPGEPQSGLYVAEYIEPSSHYNNYATPFPCQQEIVLNFVKHENDYTVTGQGHDGDGAFNIHSGYVNPYTGCTTWEEHSVSNPDQVVFTSGTFNFTSHTFQGMWTAKNGNSGTYNYFYHKTLGNPNVPTSSLYPTGESPAVLVHPNDVTISHNDDHVPTVQSEAVAIDIPLVTSAQVVVVDDNYQNNTTINYNDANTSHIPTVTGSTYVPPVYNPEYQK
jgi:hypothetical protein